MTRKIRGISDVVACNLCTGCGACAGAFPTEIRMIEDLENGRRPRLDNSRGTADREALRVCGGIGTTVEKPVDAVERDWGPVETCWEGYAADPEIRYKGSSGGAVTALSLAALAKGSVGGVAHVVARIDDPRLNETVISKDRRGLLRGAGSRYAQASPAEAIADISAGSNPVLFVGKPCDVASVAKARTHDTLLADKIPLTIAIFCAGAPNLGATKSLLEKLDVPGDAPLTELRYRGMGWPGKMFAEWTDRDGKARTSKGLSYAAGWGEILQKGRSWRCRICDDHTGALADISVGDPWNNPPEGDEDHGRSLIVARTAIGRELVQFAIEQGFLQASLRSRDVIAAAQPNLLETNASVWGRRAAMRMVGMPVPRPMPASTFGVWFRRLSFKRKAQSILGSFKRIAHGKLWRTVSVKDFEASQ